MIKLLIILLWFLIGFFGGNYYWKKNFKTMDVFFNTICGILGPFGLAAAAALYYTDPSRKYDTR
jgi:hypothetical protein